MLKELGNNLIMRNLLSRNLVFAILIVIFVNISHISSCYITNCPWGGKRSYMENNEVGFDVTRQCRKCASGLGTCFGPRICCGTEIGCLIDTKESAVCRFEDSKSLIPCTPYGKSCDKVEFGRCATANLCCNPQHCLEDSKCSQEDQENVSENLDAEQEQERNQEIDRKLLKALNYLLEKQNRQQHKSIDPLAKVVSRQLKIENDK